MKTSQPILRKPKPMTEDSKDKTSLAAWQALLAEARDRPWMLRVLVQRGAGLIRRFFENYQRLLALSGQQRRAWMRKVGMGLAGVALIISLNGGAIVAAPPPATANAQINGSDCDLIDAIVAANTDTATGACNAGSGPDTITLLDNVIVSAVDNTGSYGPNGLPRITSAITIEGASFSISRSSGDEFRLFEVVGTGDLSLNNVTISGGSTADYGGGAIFNAGAMNVTNSTFSGNSGNYGGAIRNDGVLTVGDSTFNNNTATDNDGGAIRNDGTLAVNNSTFSGNMAPEGNGGGIFTDSSTAQVTNSTFSGNSADYGGGIWNEYDLTLKHNTITDNDAAKNGGGIYNKGLLTIGRSIVSGNRVFEEGGELYNDGKVTSLGYNLFGHDRDRTDLAFYNFSPEDNDIIASNGGTHPTLLTDILNTTLADNGGPTLTHALASGSPAIDAARDGGYATDQRGVTRAQGLNDDIGAVESGNALLNGRDCDLIDAIIAANTDTATGLCVAGNSGADTITLLADVTLTTYHNSNPGGANGLPIVDSDIILDGAGRTISRDSGAADFRIFYVNSSGNLTLNQVTISGGQLLGKRGAGLYNNGALNLNNSTISGNTSYVQGGGVFNGGILTLNNSTISGNTGRYGGGVFNGGGTVTVNSSTLSNNSAQFGGGIANEGTVTLARSIVSGNDGDEGGDELAEYGRSGGITGNNYNLLGHSGVSTDSAFLGFTPSGSDITATYDGTNPTPLSNILDTNLADNGGPTFTHALVAGSPALNAAGDSGLATDQRGIARAQGAADDMGAVEEVINAHINGSDCDLIDAITAANSDAAAGLCSAGSSGADSITLLSDVILTGVDNRTDELGGNGLPVVTSEITIEGNNFAITRTTDSLVFRLLEVSPSGDLTLNQITLGGGHAAYNGNGRRGGAVFVNSGALTVAQSTLTGNHAEDDGGAILNNGSLK